VRTRSIIAGASLSLAGVLAPGAGAQCIAQSILPADVASEEYLVGIDVEGDLALVAGTGDFTATSAFLLERTPAGWSPLEAWTAGTSVLVSRPVKLLGDWAFVGAPETDSGAGWLSGAVFVYHRGAAGWGLHQSLTPSDSASGDFFGIALAADGETLVVHASHGFKAVGDHSPRLYVFELAGGTWSEVQRIEPPRSSYDYAQPLAVEGDLFVFGDYGDSAHGSASGAVQVYERPAGVWVATERFFSPAPRADAHFGKYVDVDGGRIFTTEALGSGAASGAVARVFERGASGWESTQTFAPATSGVEDRAGAIDVEEGRAVMLGFYAPWPGSHSWTSAFELDGGSWTERATFERRSGGFNGYFVELDGDRAWVCSSSSVAIVDFGVDATGTFCSPGPSSTGVEAGLDASGCDSVLANALRLRAGPLPPGAATLLLAGTSRTSQPFGNGELCVDSPRRVGLGIPGSSGFARFDLDLGRLGTGAVAGSTWLFQAAFRDPAAGGAAFDTSTARWVTLAP